MANFYIEEFDGVQITTRNGATLPMPGKFITAQKITTSGTTAQSAAFNAATRFVMYTGDAAHVIDQGADPDATASVRYIPANAPRYEVASPGDKAAARTV